MEIGAVSEVTNPRLGLPNPTNECSSCGAKDRKACEGLMHNLDDIIFTDIYLFINSANFALTVFPSIFRALWLYQVSIHNTTSIFSIRHCKAFK